MLKPLIQIMYNYEPYSELTKYMAHKQALHRTVLDKQEAFILREIIYDDPIYMYKLSEDEILR